MHHVHYIHEEQHQDFPEMEYFYVYIDDVRTLVHTELPLIQYLWNIAGEKITWTIGLIENAYYYTFPTDFLKFTALENNSSVDLFHIVENQPKNINLQYCTDGLFWKTYTIPSVNEHGEIIQLLQTNNCVYFRGNNSSGFNSAYVTNPEEGGSEKHINYINKFSSTGKIKVSGNLLSLLYSCEYLYEKNVIDKGDFCYLFNENTSIIDASELKLTSTQLTETCYGGMFEGCTYLKNAPELPATTVNKTSYANMFYNCTSLENAPELPATEVLSGGYSSMFYNCTSLENSPIVEMENTKEYSCYSMFNGCTKLKESPLLKTAKLEKGSYEQMFYNCTKLHKITCLATDINATNCTINWVTSVGSSVEAGVEKEFYGKNSIKDKWISFGSNSGIPTGFNWKDYNE